MIFFTVGKRTWNGLMSRTDVECITKHILILMRYQTSALALKIFGLALAFSAQCRRVICDLSRGDERTKFGVKVPLLFLQILFVHTVPYSRYQHVGR